jgi:hypothetical protein
VPPGWKRGDPITYFMRTGIDMMQAAGTGEWKSLARGTPPFPVKTQEGVLLSGGLPGQVAEVYHKNEVPIAANTVVFDTQKGADLEVYWVTTGVSVVAGFILLISAMAVAIRQRKQARSAPVPSAEWER